MKQRTALLKGTLDLMILKTLGTGPRHGLAISERIEQITGGTFAVKAGSLFPALHRLEQDGLIAGEWERADGRRIKSYRLTPRGRNRLDEEKKQWARIVAAVGQILDSN